MVPFTGGRRTAGVPEIPFHRDPASTGRSQVQALLVRIFGCSMAPSSGPEHCVACIFSAASSLASLDAFGGAPFLSPARLSPTDYQPVFPLTSTTRDILPSPALTSFLVLFHFGALLFVGSRTLKPHFSLSRSPFDPAQWPPLVSHSRGWFQGASSATSSWHHPLLPELFPVEKTLSNRYTTFTSQAS